MNSNDPSLMYTEVDMLMAEDEAAQLLHHNNMEAIMAYEIEEGQVSVFVNDKDGNDKRPDYTGKGLFNGQEFQISLWKTTSKNGLDYMSGKVQKPYNGGSSSYTGSSESLEDVPF